MTLKHDYFECICDGDDHFLRISYFVDVDTSISKDINDELYVSVQLPSRSLFGYIDFINQPNVSKWKFWKRFSYEPGRIWIALKYLFGYKCIYGHWQSTTLTREEASRLCVLLTNYINTEDIQ
jgi:hypothetical protein